MSDEQGRDSRGEPKGAWDDIPEEANRGECPLRYDRESYEAGWQAARSASCGKCARLERELAAMSQELACPLVRDMPANGTDRIRAMVGRIVRLEDTGERDSLRAETAEAALERIDNWAKAYPLDVFPEPDLKRVAAVLKENGLTLDAVSASNMRHVITQVKEIVTNALEGRGEPT